VITKEYKIFDDKFLPLKDLNDEIPKDIAKVLKMPDNCKVETACFSPDGQYLVTGTTDGYIEVWDPFAYKHSSDIVYQQDDIFMMHDKLITALAVSSDSQFLCSASEDNTIKIWRMSKGACLRKFENSKCHINCLMFAKDDSQVITGSDRVKQWG